MVKKSETLGKHPSSSSNKIYTVKRITEPDGSMWLGCNCPAFTIAKKWKGVPSSKRECGHTRLHLLDDPAIEENAPPVQLPEIVYAKVREVTREDGQLLVPLMPIPCPTHFEATIVYDLLKSGIPWQECRSRYSLAKRNPMKNIIAYVEERGRCICGPHVGQWDFYKGYVVVPVEG